MRQYFLVLINERYPDSIRLLYTALGHPDADLSEEKHKNSASKHLHGSEYALTYSTMTLLKSAFVNELADYHFGISQFEDELSYFGV